MKDMGIVQGCAQQAVPVVIGKDTVYVHTNIKQLPPDEHGSVLFEYHEIQYDKDEYIFMMDEKAENTKEAVEFLIMKDMGVL